MSHDFRKPIEKTSTELAKIILGMIADGKDKLIYEYDPEESKELKAKHDEEGTDFAINVFRLISATDIPADYAGQSIQKLIILLETLKKYVEGSITQTEDEIISRLLEARSPMNNKYRRECVTIGTLLLKLNELREKQGNKPEDYFNDDKDLSTVVADNKK